MGAAAQRAGRTAIRACLAALATGALAALGSAPAPAAAQDVGRDAIAAGGASADLSATIRRTARGIPHVLADDYAGLGYGYGYALAEDNVCVLADSYTTVRGRRSKFFGPDESYDFGGNGSTVNNNPKSPHFADQTKMFSDKRWVDMRFCRREIQTDPRLEVKRLR